MIRNYQEICVARCTTAGLGFVYPELFMLWFWNIRLITVLEYSLYYRFVIYESITDL